jgi:hypothetical protein
MAVCLMYAVRVCYLAVPGADDDMHVVLRGLCATEQWLYTHMCTLALHVLVDARALQVAVFTESYSDLASDSAFG